jgi:salicylate hydroxylase
VAGARTVIIAGAGIGGLTTALALTRAGFRASLIEQSPKLQEVGAGMQLGPNASRILIALGLWPRLAHLVTIPESIRVMSGGSAREIARIPLGLDAQERYGAPYWCIHRADLQAALADAAAHEYDISLKLGVKLEEFAAHVNGVSALGRHAQTMIDERGIALIGADGIWSTVAKHLRQKPAKFAHRIAWRTLMRAEDMPAEFRTPDVHLWLGLDAHLVHYPLRGGRLYNMIGIAYDEWSDTGWSTASNHDEVLRHFARWVWHDKVRELIALPQQWLKWALYERRSPFSGGQGPVTLIGDAAHPMLPFLAQGAGMAIEDAAVLADRLAKHAGDPAKGLRAYEAARRARTARAQRASRKQGNIYGLTGPEALVRNLGMKMLGGEKLLARQDWLYTWQPPKRFRITA